MNPSGFRTDLRELVEHYHSKLRSPLSADEIVKELADAFQEQDTDDALKLADELLDGHGVEALGPVDTRKGPPYLYINFGDTYDPTIMWSRDDNKVFVAMGGWGDVWSEEGEPNAFDEAWRESIASEFNHALEEEAISQDPEHDDDEPVPGGVQEKALALIEADDTKQLFEEALHRVQRRGASGSTRYPEIEYGDSWVNVHHMNVVVREAAEMLHEGWEPKQTPNASTEPWDQDGFERLLKSELRLGDRRVSIRGGGIAPGSLFVTFINLPAGVGSAGGGAEAENNRMTFQVKGPRGQGTYADDKPVPSGKVRVEQSVSALPREYRLRAKTGTPEAIASYLAEFLNKVAREVEPRFTHTHRPNGAHYTIKYALAELAGAAIELDRHIQLDRDDHDFAEKYPFKHSFDEVAHDILTWREIVAPDVRVTDVHARTLARAFQLFAEAMKKLDSAVARAEPELRDDFFELEGYPFKESLDEVEYAVSEWVKAQTGR